MQLWGLLFISSFLLIGAAALAVVQTTDRRRQNLRRALTGGNSLARSIASPVFLETRGSQPGSSPTGFNATLRRAGLNWSIRGALAATLVCAVCGAIAASSLRGYLGSGAAMALGAVAFGALPFLYIRRKNKRFLRQVEEQLPDAVDFLARSIRVGNALTVSLEYVVAETNEPLRSEFLRVSRELTLGAPLDTALKGLVARAPLLDLRFFVAAVLLQRETGGNLAEILDKLSVSMRERFRLKSQISAVSAQGKLTARVLTVLPLAVILMINLISPAYFKIMTGQPTGRAMLAAAVVSQVIGYLCMQKITNIEI